MEFKVYGHSGKPVLFLPCQAGRFYDFENFGMIDTWAKWIEAGKVTVFSADVIDGETYANFSGDARSRIERHESWFHYMTDELAPYIRHLSAERNGFDQPMMVFGASLGATHAANLFFRRPDLFDCVLALSGLYDAAWAFGEYTDDLIYNNTPCLYLDGMAPDHPYIEQYNRSQIAICVGQGAWEDELLASTRHLQQVMAANGIGAWFSYWGKDVSHDWCWWFRQCDYFVPKLLGL